MIDHDSDPELLHHWCGEEVGRSLEWSYHIWAAIQFETVFMVTKAAIVEIFVPPLQNIEVTVLMMCSLSCHIPKSWQKASGGHRTYRKYPMCNKCYIFQLNLCSFILSRITLTQTSWWQYAVMSLSWLRRYWYNTLASTLKLPSYVSDEIPLPIP